MEFRLLGPVEVWAGSRSVAAGPPRQRGVLAALLVDAGRPVDPSTLVERVWGGASPDGVRHALHTHVARLRRVLADAGLRTPGGGVPLVHRAGAYVLDIDPNIVDMHRFRDLVARARDHTDVPRRAEALRTALALWRGEPLAGLPGQWMARVRQGLYRQRVEACVRWGDAEVAAGHADVVIDPLADLLAENPLAEPVAEVLIRALYAAGRTAEALDCYATTRRRLVEELGTEPGPQLRAVHREVLRNEDAAPPPAAPTPVVPAQLPLDVPAFAGRTAELADLDRTLAAAGVRSAGMTIVALVGTAGVGKTTLAVHWANRVRHEFPDGQLYVNLRGFDPAGAPLDPGEVLRGFLDALGIPAERLPVDLAGRSALYRSLLADRRVLVVLDNARDAGQLRWLLPGGPRCLVLVTSRNRLPGLVAAECAHPINLDLLSPAEAEQMLAARLGPERLAAEPEAVEQIIASCARLPLAIAVAAARVATHPGFSLATIVGKLRAAGTALDAFASNDAATDVRAVCSWSYQELTTPAKRLFQLLGVHPGPDLTVAAAASLTGTHADDARSVLAELHEANLITEHIPGRYACHDLLRAYAAELAGSVEPETERRAALCRLLDHYLHSAFAADRLLDRFRDRIEAPPPCPGAVVVRLTDHADAMGWFATELTGLLRAVDRAASDGFDGHAWRLAWALAYFLERRGYWQPWAAAHRTALAAACRSGDRTGQAHAHRSLGRVHVHQGGLDEAVRHLQQAHTLFRDAGDVAGHARIHFDLCWVATRQRDHRHALEHAQQALELFQGTGNDSGHARALNNVAWGHNDLGDHGTALTFGQRALTLNQATGDRFGEADSWAILGQAHLALRHDDEAVHCCRRAVDLYRELGHRWAEADCLNRLGDAYQGAGAGHAAAGAWRRAAAILDDLGHPDADVVREKLLAPAPTHRPPDEPAAVGGQPPL